jgi:addiction module HigA family antidote
MAKSRRLPPVHPGEILREDLMTPLGLSINKLARDLRVPVTRMSEIVNGRRSITADTALRLARYFEMTPQFWMNLQAAYDLEVATRESADRIKRDVHPRASGVLHAPAESGDPFQNWPDIRLPRGTAAELIGSDRGEK